MIQRQISHHFFNSTALRIEVRYKAHGLLPEEISYSAEIFIDDVVMVKGKRFLAEPTVKDSLQYIKESNVEP